MEDINRPPSLESLMPDRLTGEGLELLKLWQSATGDPKFYFSYLAMGEWQRDAAVNGIAQDLNLLFADGGLRLPSTTSVTEMHVIHANVLVDKAVHESGILGELVLGGDHPEVSGDAWNIVPQALFGAEAGMTNQISEVEIAPATVDDINQLDPVAKLKLFDASQVVRDEYMDTTQAIVSAWATKSLVKLANWPSFTGDIRRPLAACRQRAELVKEAQTPEERRNRRHQLFQGVMKCASAVADKNDPDLANHPELANTRQDLLYAVELYDQLAETHNEAIEESRHTRASFEEAQDAKKEQVREAQRREEAAHFLQRLGELPVELEKLVEIRRMTSTKLKKEGLRHDLLDLESKVGLEREEARHLMGFIWLLRSSIARIGPESTQQLLKTDLNEENIIYWLAEKITRRLGTVGVEDPLPDEAPLARTVQLAQEYWEPLSMVLRRHAVSGTRMKERLGDVRSVLFMEYEESETTDGDSTHNIAPLTPEQARLQMILLKAVADLYHTAGIIDTTLLPEPVRASVEAERGAQEQPEQITPDEQTAESAEGVEELSAAEQYRKRHLVARVDGGRISTLHAFRQAFKESEYFTEDIFITGKDKLPYIAVVFEHEGVTYAVAENPEVGNATYVYADVPAPGRGRVPWKTVYAANREDARILYDAIQIKHPRGETTADHMEEIIAALVSFGLPPKVANTARYALRDIDRTADQPWVPSDDLEALEALEAQATT